MDNNKNNKIDIDKDEIRDWVDSLKSLVQSRGKNIAKHIINKVIDVPSIQSNKIVIYSKNS